jgi:hypothetical protein
MKLHAEQESCAGTQNEPDAKEPQPVAARAWLMIASMPAVRPGNLDLAWI